MPEANPNVAEQFEEPAQQHEAATLGMWTFLATEILFFGALFLAYIVYRHFYFDDFAAGSRRTDVVFGTTNSVILLTSSFSMALSVRAAKLNDFKSVIRGLCFTIGLGLSFLVVKGFEYHKDISDHLVPGPHYNPSLPPHSQIFFWLYWTMTGLHAVHVTAGLIVLSSITAWTGSTRQLSRTVNAIEMAGLYWHFVDIVWLFLYPLLYLVRKHS